MSDATIRLLTSASPAALLGLKTGFLKVFLAEEPGGRALAADAQVPERKGGRK